MASIHHLTLIPLDAFDRAQKKRCWLVRRARFGSVLSDRLLYVATIFGEFFMSPEERHFLIPSYTVLLFRFLFTRKLLGREK